MEELTAKAEEAESLRDELEEYKHELERMNKLETLLEKYKRKVEDTTDLKRQIKVINAMQKIAPCMLTSFDPGIGRAKHKLAWKKPSSGGRVSQSAGIQNTDGLLQGTSTTTGK